MNLISPRLRSLVDLCLCYLFVAIACSATAQVLFFDDFNGPTLNSAWQANLPTMNSAGMGPFNAPLSETYVGAPTYSFQSLGGASVIRMNEVINQQQRVGFRTSSVFSPSTFRYEIRFNTLTQSSGTSIDGFIEVGLLDAANPNRYDLISPYGHNFSAERTFDSGSSIDNTYTNQPFNYLNNTWYRLIIQAAPSQNIHVSLADDSGNELIGRNLSHGASAYGSGFQLIFSQSMGFAGNGHSCDVAVDYASLTVPEPSCLSLILVIFACAHYRKVLRN
jgi:hypothetical protein